MSFYTEFSREDWGQLYLEQAIPFDWAVFRALQEPGQVVALQEWIDIYWPLSRLLSARAAAILNQEARSPYLIAVTGSVAVGKSSVATVLQALLQAGPSHPRVEVIATDGYLFPNSVLNERGLMSRKGFPESYDAERFVQFLNDLKSGKPALQVPVFSHRSKDILLETRQCVHLPDIAIIEGVNAVQLVTDFFDFSLYLDADTHLIKKWYRKRFLKMAESQGKVNDRSDFNLSAMSERAESLWLEVNEKNLLENILPYKDKVQLIFQKTQGHQVRKIFLRKAP